MVAARAQGSGSPPGGSARQSSGKVDSAEENDP